MNFFINKYLDNKIINRKIKKLKKDPELFFKDLIFNAKTNLSNAIPFRFDGNNQYSIISACYNVEEYLEDYFNSIVSQSMNFENNIFIICVDDGSTDHTPFIIKKWEKKYPHNIKYVYKSNGGQASARNLGLEWVETEWVTFLDPDDMLSKQYFRVVDKTISKNKNVNMVAANLLFYFEISKSIQDTHPLKFRFNKSQKIEKEKLGKNIHLHAASTFFKRDILKLNNIKFDENIKPNFEDAKFVVDYISCLSNIDLISFEKEAIYLYRKREAGNSTLDTAWEKKGLFYDVLNFGVLKMLEDEPDKDNIPVYKQQTALYHLIWYFKRLLNNDHLIAFLSDKEKEVFLQLLFKIFSYIDEDVIYNFNLAGCWFIHKAGLLGMFKNKKPKDQIVYIENIDKYKKQILLSYYTYNIGNIIIEMNSQEIIPSTYKVVKNIFAGQYFVSEVRLWVSYEEEADVLDVYVDGKKSKISLFGKHYNSLKASVFISKFEEKSKNKYTNDGSWIFMDRDTQADDNAEHLYRYIMENKLKDNCYFVLRKSSSDWMRLENEGFKLIDFSSPEFEENLRSCDKIISSHLDRYITNYFGDEYGYSKKFIFLQHGVTHNNLSDWFNSKKNLQCIVATSNQEYSSFVHDNIYKLTSKEVILSGFPRHDSLLNSLNTDNVILIMPTWRNYLVGNALGDGNGRILNPNFMDTDYAQNWYNVLHDPKLRSLALKCDYEIIFAPHANIVPYLDLFNVPSYIQVWTKNSSNLSIQNLFQKSKFMVTDYSSVAFEMAYLGKQVIYYQFDKKDFFSGGHIFKKGYFDYETHGFGPIASLHNDLIIEVEKLLLNNGKASDFYLDRINNTFAYRDTNNCKRVYDHINQMDKFEEPKVNMDILNQFILSAKNSGNLSSLYSRFRILIDNFGIQAFKNSCDVDLFVYLLTVSADRSYSEISLKSAFFENLSSDEYQQNDFEMLDPFYKLINLFNLNKNEEFKSYLTTSWPKLNSLDQKIVKFIELFLNSSYDECFDYYQTYLCVENFDLTIRMQLFNINQIYFKLLILMNKNSLINNFYSKQIEFFQEYPELVFEIHKPNFLAS